MNFEYYKQAASYLEHTALQDKLIRHSSPTAINTVRAEFFALLGNPERDMKYVHVAGTSGKGSVTQLIQQALYLSGKKSGCFCSPYTTTPIEKIKVDELYISPDDFIRLVAKIQEAVSKMRLGKPSWHEMYTALALLYFHEQKVDYAVLEVGVGGTYDATNIIPTPEVSVITTIGYDHQSLLGNTLSEIATHKAGIIKSGTYCITYDSQTPEVLMTIKTRCATVDANLEIVPVQNGSKPMHIRINHALVWAACKQLKINPTAIQAAFTRTHIPCRFETIQLQPRVIIDGAHNESKMAATLDSLTKVRYNKLYSIIGMSKQKDAQVLFNRLTELSDHTYITHTPRHFKSLAPDTVAQHLGLDSETYSIYSNPFDALAAALTAATADDCIIITGSLYLAGLLRTQWRSEQTILQERKS